MAEKPFHPLSFPQKVPGYFQHAKTTAKNLSLSMIRDNFTISTWLLIGGLFQGVAVVLLGNLTLLPAAAVIAYRVGDNLLMAGGWKKNRYLSGVFFNRFTVQVPRSDGSFGSTPADGSVVVFLIGAKSNHPFGIFDPVYRKIGSYFSAMVRELQSTAKESGLLGTTSWVSTNENAANEIMSVMYFQDYQSLYKYAHGPFHMKAVKYWSRIVKDNPHISIFHETYVVPKGQWETIYINSKLRGLSATAFPVRSAQGNGETEWMSPIVDSRHPALRTAAGRIQADYLKGSEKYNEIWNLVDDGNSTT